MALILLLFLNGDEKTGPAAKPHDWPQWRGSQRDGVWREHGLPDDWLPTEMPPRWRQPIGGGYSGIAVANRRVYTMDHVEAPAEVERILCLDAATGKAIWIHSYSVHYGKLDYGNGPRSTPTIDGKRVYTFGALGHLCCLDAETGSVIWSKDTVAEFKGRAPMWGYAGSPLVDGNRLIVQIGGETDACIVALDKATGRVIWTSLSDRPGYSSPVLIDGALLLAWTAEHLTGLNPATGKPYWQIPHTTEYDVTIADPVVHDGTILISDYWEGSIALRLEKPDVAPTVTWKGRRLSLLMSTPLCRDGFVYALDRNNGLKCIELKSGEIKWDGFHITPKGRNPQASLVWIGLDRALVFNELGELILVRLTPKGHEELGKTKVIEGTWSHPAYAEKCIFVRNDKEIVCMPLVK